MSFILKRKKFIFTFFYYFIIDITRSSLASTKYDVEGLDIYIDYRHSDQGYGVFHA